MRIIAGSFRGRVLASPAGRRVRPTADRVREAWFSIVGPAVHGAAVLDLFAGSGALGFEALSRGAARAVFVDVAAGSLGALRTNISTLDVGDRATVHRADALRFAAALPAGAYDVAFADPPFTSDQADRLLALHRECAFARVLGIEHPADRSLGGDDTRRYGSIALTFSYGS